MISRTKLYISLIIALSISCIPQFSYTKFITLENEEQYAALIESKQPFILLFTTRQYEHNTEPELINDRVGLYIPGTPSGIITAARVNQAAKEVAEEQEFDNITIARVDVEIDKFQSLASLYHIKRVPTFLYFNNGSQINQSAPTFRKTEYYGYSPSNLKESLRKNIRDYLINKPKNIQYFIDLIVSFIQKIIQSIKNLFN